jgi:hypothetical protein
MLKLCLPQLRQQPNTSKFDTTMACHMQWRRTMVVKVWLSPSGLKPLRLTQFGTVATIFNTIAILISTLVLVRPPPQVCLLPKFKVITWLPTKQTLNHTIAILISTLDLVRPPPQVCFLPKFNVITWLPTKTDPKPLMLFASSRPAGTTCTVRYASYASSCAWISQREARTGNRLMLPA